MLLSCLVYFGQCVCLPIPRGAHVGHNFALFPILPLFNLHRTSTLNTLVLPVHHKDVDDLAEPLENVPNVGLNDAGMQRPHVNHGRRILLVILLRLPLLTIVKTVLRLIKRLIAMWIMEYDRGTERIGSIGEGHVSKGFNQIFETFH